MPLSLDNLGWFYRGDTSPQDSPATNKAISTFLSFTAILGIFVVATWTFSLVRLISSLYILPGRKVQPPLMRLYSSLTSAEGKVEPRTDIYQLSTFGTPSKTYAIITGASDGLGREYALQLSALGFHTLLVSRTASKLSSVASAITSKYPNCIVKTHAIDFARASSTDYNNLKSAIDDLSSGGGSDGKEVGILINNVGLSHSIPVPFSDTPTQEVEDIITINNLATLKVTQLVLPHLIARRKGLILTMGSFGGMLPTPLLATYSGSKAFLQHWSTALASELAPHNITVELVQSYLVTTAMSKIRRTSALIPGPREFVRSVLSSIGRTGGAQGFSYTSTSYWSHALMQWGMLRVVGVHSKVALAYNKVMHEGIRKRALKKQARESGQQAKGTKGE